MNTPSHGYRLLQMGMGLILCGCMGSAGAEPILIPAIDEIGRAHV